MNPIATPLPRRLVLLGASNLSNCLSIIAGTARAVWPGPLEIVAAHGYGRSYGRTSWVFWRGLPSILHCGLWEALDRRSPAPTAALVTDVGNDLLYEVEVDQISDWLDECLARLRPRVERLVLTELPLASVSDLSDWWYLTLRSCYFPTCRLAKEEVVERARRLNERVIEFGRRYDAAVVRPRGEWYDFDPIHPRPTRWPEVWRELLAPWADETSALEQATHSPLEWARCQVLFPERWMWGKREMHASQPAAQLSDGSTLELY